MGLNLALARNTAKKSAYSNPKIINTTKSKTPVNKDKMSNPTK